MKKSWIRLTLYIVSLGLCVVFFTIGMSKEIVPISSVKTESVAIPTPKSRPLYAYSLVPGGVGSIAELHSRISSNPILAKYFAHFNWAKATVIMFGHDMDVWMVFQRGSNILWTKRRVHIKAGELAVTDGVMTIMMRCGNAISWAPEEPSEDLPPSIIESPITPTLSDTYPEIPPSLINSPPDISDILDVPSSAIPPTESSVGGPSGFFYPTMPVTPWPFINPTSAVPENSTIVLLFFGLISLTIVGDYFKRNIKNIND